MHNYSISNSCKHIIHLTYTHLCLPIDWRLSIPATVLQTLPTFGGPTVSAPLNLSSIMTAPIPTVRPVPTTSYTYPQELPSKLVKKILDLEFVEMAELVPDSWRDEEADYQCCSTHTPRTPRRGPVTNILLWVECYSSLVAVLSSKYPTKIGHFMAYQKMIIKAQRTFVGERWVVYDSCFRRKAANTKNLDWGEVDLNLYNETFVGRAKVLQHYTTCLSELHTTAECNLFTSPRSVSQTGSSSGWRPGERKSVPICLLYNDREGNRCTYAPDCKYGHTCSACQGRHPFSRCPNKRPHPYASRNHPEAVRQRKK